MVDSLYPTRVGYFKRIVIVELIFLWKIATFSEVTSSNGVPKMPTLHFPLSAYLIHIIFLLSNSKA